ncbi:MAG: hypothetical protein U5O15_02755 [Candidatus Krumholzibacteriota bacterium]|nr:hypothetical protein [Candidatus Krumholzibacteriota bacterium]
MESLEGGGEKEKDKQEYVLKEIELEEEKIEEEKSISRQEIFYRRGPWYEKQRWDEILNERTRWGDLSIENQKKLIKISCSIIDST